jgi:hypothetical protein
MTSAAALVEAIVTAGPGLRAKGLGSPARVGDFQLTGCKLVSRSVSPLRVWVTFEIGCTMQPI